MKFLLLASIAVGVAGWNYASFLSLQNPSVSLVERASKDHAAHAPNAKGLNAQDAIELPWALLEKLTLPSQPNAAIAFPKELEALDGKYVYVPGVFSPMAQLKSGDSYQGGVLQPPSKISCCGLTCDPRTQLLIFVDCAVSPWKGGSARLLTAVTGKLELVRQNSAWGCTALSDVQITPLK